MLVKSLKLCIYMSDIKVLEVDVGTDVAPSGASAGAGAALTAAAAARAAAP